MTSQHNPLLVALLLFVVLLGFSSSAHAACTGPSGSEGAIIYSAAAKQLQFCNGSVWVNTGATVQTVGGSGASSSFAGSTSSTYTGGGISGYVGVPGMDELCDSEFTGSRMMRYSDYLNLTAALAAQSDDGWVFCDSGACADRDYLAYASNCDYGKSAAATRYNAYYKASDDGLSATACNNLKKIMCVYD
jgi:hypothetical protein